jgi:hypothetical protein
MKFYEPMIEKNYECINACNGEDYEIFNLFNGEALTRSWRPIKVIRGLKADHRRPAAKPSDFPWLVSHALVVSSTAIVSLRDILDAHGELLPLDVEDGSTLFVFNSKVVDALDEKRSSIVKFPGTDRIMQIKKVSFVESKIQGLDIFRLPHRASVTYVSEGFVERVKAAGLKGLTFTKVYDSEESNE